MRYHNKTKIDFLLIFVAKKQRHLYTSNMRTLQKSITCTKPVIKNRIKKTVPKIIKKSKENDDEPYSFDDFFDNGNSTVVSNF